MSIYYTLYKAVKSLCPSGFRGSFSTLNMNSEKSYGVFLKGGTPSGRTVDKGVNLIRSANVVFNVTASKGVNGTLEGYKFCEEVIHTLERTFNYTYTDNETGEKVVIISVDVLGDINALGVNQYDIPVFSMNFIINYAEGGN